MVNEKLHFSRIVIEATNNCNNHCRHCYNYWRKNGSSDYFKNELSRDQIIYLICKVLKDTPLESVAISGGEPFLRNDLSAIINDLYKLGLWVVVITNGTLIRAENINSIPHQTAFELTLFSHLESVHNKLAGRNSFEKVLSSIIKIKKNGYYLAVGIVITKMNYSDIKNTIKLAIALGADAILLNRINLGRNSIVHAKVLVPSVQELNHALYLADRCAEKYGISVAVSVPIPPCLINPEDFPNLIFGWCPRGNDEAYYTIGNTGSVRPCNHSSLILGNLFIQDFREIVSNDLSKKYWRQIPPECLDCDNVLRDKCKGGCIAACYECNGTGKAMDPFISLSKGKIS